MRLLRTLLLLFFFVFVFPCAFSVAVFGAEREAVDYARDIKPLLAEKCAACHGTLKQESDLRLDAGSLIHEGGASGPVVVPGKPDDSLLLYRLSVEDESERMPPAGEGEPLTAAELQRIEQWIRAGAPFPQDEPLPVRPGEHWAYQLPTRPAVPMLDPEFSGWSANPLDAFIAQQHQSSSLTPAALADKATLLRRVHLDLVGLPPTREELQTFLVEDHSDAAYRQIVDRLLNSPHYGERWGRHWMDIWRYSDWDGYKDQLRGSQRHIWRWRDWIIESLNADKGYDQMVLEMLAGDELAPENSDALRATGYLARNYHHSNRNIWLDATVEHTAKAFLGMTINCARCHDHKFDPLAQTEYYAMRAIFEPHHVRTERMPGQANLLLDGLPRAFDSEPEAKTYLFIRGNEKHVDKDRPLAPAVPAVFNRPLEITPVPLPPVAVFPALQPHIEREELSAAASKVSAAEKQLDELHTKLATSNSTPTEEAGLPAGEAGQSEAATEPEAPMAENDPSAATPLRIAELRLRAARAELESLRARWSANKAKYGGGVADPDAESLEALARTAARCERLAQVHAAELKLCELQHAATESEFSDDDDKEQAKKQAALKKAREQIPEAEEQLKKARAAARSDTMEYTSVGKAYPGTSTGRRLALARWIADRQNPLTARVAVNHIWMRHFGEPLVDNVFDFGLRSPRPVHAKLLDWLAVELMENNWSMKHLHRLIVTSRTYRLASSASAERTAANQQHDPDNRLFWRANVRRMDAEVVRDSVLKVAGSLDKTLGGPDIEFAKGETVARRSVYFQHAYEKQMTMLLIFDAAGPVECYRRSESIIPQQALALANSTLSLAESRKLARRLWSEVEGDAEPEQRYVRAAFAQILTRLPDQAELSACREFLAEQTATLADSSSLTGLGGTAKAAVEASADPAMRARENLVHVLMNHNDFVTIR